MNTEEYGILVKRTDIGLEMIESAGGFQEAPRKWVDEFQRLCERMLAYEIENDLLPI